MNAYLYTYHVLLFRQIFSLFLCGMIYVNVGIIDGGSKTGECPPGYSSERLPEGFDEGGYLVLIANSFEEIILVYCVFRAVVGRHC